MITHYKKYLPYSRKGFGLAVNTFASGRISATVAAHGGITSVCWYGRQSPFRQYFFNANPDEGVFLKIARVQVLIDGIPYRIEMNKTVHYPFGYETECTLDGVRIGYALILDNHAILQRVKVLNNPSGKAVSARLWMTSCCQKNIDGRQFSPWTLNHSSQVAECTAFDTEDKIATKIRFGCLGKGAFDKYETQSFKILLNSPEPAGEHVFYLVFDPDSYAPLSATRVDEKRREFEARRRHNAIFKTGNKTLDSALVNALYYIPEFEIPDLPGAVKASPSYWVWGWDGLVHLDAQVLCGNAELVRRTLLFFRDTADPIKGLSSAYDTSCRQVWPLSPPVQGYYVVALHHYVLLTGDEATLEACLPLARKIIERALAWAQDDILVRGKAYFPDSPQCLGQGDDDFSIINNSIFYQAIRAWNTLTGERTAEAERLATAFQAFRDPITGYMADSIDGKTGELRRHFPVHAQMQISHYALEHDAACLDPIAAYLKKHFLMRHGLSMFELNSKAFMADGIMLGEYFPGLDRYYWNVMNRVGDSASVDDFTRIVTAYWRICTYPEGQTNDIVNSDPTEYEDTPSLKYGSTMKGWCADALDLRLGLQIGHDGLGFHPLASKQPFEVNGLHLRGCRLDITVSGMGGQSEFIFNNRKLETASIAWKMLKKKNLLQIKFSPPPTPSGLRPRGAEKNG
jgi:hypothetical protein